MNQLEERLLKLKPAFLENLNQTVSEVELLLNKYERNFPTYTDHSLSHTKEVFKIASDLLTEGEINNLNADEIYILSMACYLHDIGMCIPENKISEIGNSEIILQYKKSHPKLGIEEFIRDIHHILSYNFIMEEWSMLKIPDKKYAQAIALVAQGHRKVDLGNIDQYPPKFFVKNGREFVCLPYLSCILRIADELDISNIRTPKLLTKYYIPNNEISVREWQKHISTSQINFTEDKVIFNVECSDYNIYAALQEQFEKIQNVINYCQKTIRTIANTERRNFNLKLHEVDPKYNFIGFDPKGIKFSFDVQNVVTAFIGEDLYKDKLTALREVIQNSIDSCRYKTKILKENYKPFIKITIQSDKIKIEDNGSGMDEFIIENYFGRLGSSFYAQEKIKNEFEAIGQFGVGVFSYFLLSEYIDIETKMAGQNSLKFRLDKDPKSYFHFYDKADREEVGTTITMYLKKEIVEKLNFRLLEDYIRRIFRYIEFPICISGEGNDEIIKFSSFNINSEVIKKGLKLHNKKEFKSLELIDIEINNEEFEGVCTLITSKDKSKIFSNKRNLFDNDFFFSKNAHRTLSLISFSQKGIFVNNYSSSFLNFFLGNINIKKKLRINIDRNEFSDIQDVYNTLSYFELEILKKIYSNLVKEFDIEILHQISYDLLINYASLYDELTFSNYHLNDFFINFTYLKVYSDNVFEILNISELLNKHKQFILISEFDNEKEIWNYFKTPLIIIKGYNYSGAYDQIRNILKFGRSLNQMIEIFENKAYEKYSTENSLEDFKANIEKINYIRKTRYQEIVDIRSDAIVQSILWNKYFVDIEYYEDIFYFNYNHPFLKFVLKNYSVISMNDEYKNRQFSSLAM